MNLLVGLGLAGPSFTPRDMFASGARLGHPTWGPGALARDLELRLGIPPTNTRASIRVPRWAARIQALANPRAFYAASFAADPIGTAETVLAWRDALVEAGWNGDVIPGGGERLDALAAIERYDAESLPLGDADRLVAIGRELASCRARIYERIELIEPRTLWPRQWVRIFDRLEALGATIGVLQPTLPGAPADTDLGLLQRLLRDDVIAAAEPSTSKLRGDGTLLLLRGETPAELGELVAAFVARTTKDDVLVIRALDPAPLESALARHGLATQGHVGTSAWRPAAQVLPLALELAFEPRDPYRVLELLTLPVGPFRGRLGRMLARAVARQPGIGGQEWERRKAAAAMSLRERQVHIWKTEGTSDAEADALADLHVADRMQRVRDWLETPGAKDGVASRALLLETTERVRKWLQPQAAPDGDRVQIYGAAYAQAKAFTEALVHHPAHTLTREDAQHLFDTVARGAERHDLFVEQAGRAPHVDHPSALIASAPTVVFWNFVAGTERRPLSIPWNAAEQRALEGVGVMFVDPARQLSAEANAWRRAVLAARERVVFVVPRSHKGTAMSAHPLWDEILARLAIDEDPAAVSRLTRDVAMVLRTGGQELAQVEELPPIPLPDARPVWNLPPDTLLGDDAIGISATAVQTLVSCPLAWVLGHRADLDSGAVAKVATGSLLNGNLSHRLVEELYKASAFDLDEGAFLARVDDVQEALVRAEGATLLLQGAAFEHAQLSRQIRHAMRELHRYLRTAGFRIAAVEETVSMQTPAGNMHGRLDVRLVDKNGKDALLDLKWGASTYRSLLEKGRAIQLAVYSLSLKKTHASVPPAAYYAISNAKVLTADPRMKAPTTLEGISLEETWRRVERTRAAVQASLAKGTVPVADTRRALPLLEQLKVPEDQRETYYESEREAQCKYCEFPALCGRAWEGLQ